MKVLLTGATGFVGRAIAEELIRNRFDLFAVGRRETNADLPNYVRADITDFADLEKWVAAWSGVRCIVHNAGLAHQFKAVDDRNFWRVNLEGTKNVAEIAARLKAKKFILISSVSVYGESAGEISVSEDFPCEPRGAYAESKLAAEKIAEKICRENRVELTVLRLATVYGEGNVGNVRRLLKMIDERKFFWIGRGENLKSLVHCDDAARAVCLAIEKKSAAGVYNVVGQTVAMREIVDNLAKALEKPLPDVFIPKSLILAAANASAIILPLKKLKSVRNILTKWLANDIFDGNKFRRAFDFEPRVALEAGLTREVAWYKNAEKSVGKFDA